jgi:NitT/TauT family transport system ATP-binding protein
LWEGSGKTIVFVTHDIDEALVLADRVIALQSGGRIAVDVTVTLGRPRDARKARLAPDFIELHEQLLDALSSDPDAAAHGRTTAAP